MLNSNMEITQNLIKFAIMPQQSTCLTLCMLTGKGSALLMMTTFQACQGNIEGCTLYNDLKYVPFSAGLCELAGLF